jgi:single-stranded DNA-binding protein
MENLSTNNKVFLMGTVKTEPSFSHEMYGEGFYDFFLAVPRLSGQEDVIPVTVSERLIKTTLKAGDKVALDGQFRSYNKLIDGKSKLMLTVFVRDFLEYDEFAQNPNSVELNGYVCKEPIYRTTPFNREICDILLAVNRSYNKSDYIPCIAWGRNARFAHEISVGTNVTVAGRIQSREYNKKLEDKVEVRVAYELSISKIDVIQRAGDLSVDESAATTVDENATAPVSETPSDDQTTD